MLKAQAEAEADRIHKLLQLTASCCFFGQIPIMSSHQTKSATRTNSQVILKQNRKKQFCIFGHLIWREMPQVWEHQVLSVSQKTRELDTRQSQQTKFASCFIRSPLLMLCMPQQCQVLYVQTYHQGKSINCSPHFVRRTLFHPARQKGLSVAQSLLTLLPHLRRQALYS